MEKLENYWYNLYINQKAFLDFEYENSIEYSYFDYNDCAIIGYIIFMLKSNIKGFHYEVIDGRKYIYLTNKLILKQLPKLKKTMLNKRLEKMVKKEILYRVIECEHIRYLSVNTDLLNKSPDNMIYPTDFLKKVYPEIYENIIEYFKKDYDVKTLQRIIESYNLDRVVQQKDYSPKSIYEGLVNYIRKWDSNKYK